jgi:RNA polymerase sigma factor (sigma-70 family)
MRTGVLARVSCPGANSVAAAETTDAELLARFARVRDEAAFEALVRRHGPMVLGVCRRVLPESHDAEEAFQVTFVVLARKAGELKQPGRLASWLYGVANRVSRKARVSAARRGKHERAAAGTDSIVPLDGLDADVRSVLDEEMLALPEKYRAPLVLCYLEGLTNEAAAERLGWPSGSMSYRLSRGRDLLRKRLIRRGVMLAMWPIFWQTLSESASAHPVPERLVEATVERAMAQPPASAAPGRAISPAVLLALVLIFLGLGSAAVVAYQQDRTPTCGDPGTTGLSCHADPLPAP